MNAQLENRAQSFGANVFSVRAEQDDTGTRLLSHHCSRARNLPLHTRTKQKNPDKVHGSTAVSSSLTVWAGTRGDRHPLRKALTPDPLPFEHQLPSPTAGKMQDAACDTTCSSNTRHNRGNKERTYVSRREKCSQRFQKGLEIGSLYKRQQISMCIRSCVQRSRDRVGKRGKRANLKQRFGDVDVICVLWEEGRREIARG